MGQEPEKKEPGQEPGDGTTTTTTPAEPEVKGQEPETFDRDYVKKLREEAADWRTKAQDANTKVKEFEDRDKSDQQKKEEAAVAAEARATAAETKALRFEVAASKGVPLEQAHRLQGTTKEELEADAEEFKKSLGEQQRTGFDGGTRQPVPAGDMDAAIRRSAGRG